jgi:protein-disulfide isomerase-like protein with CxxC motif
MAIPTEPTERLAYFEGRDRARTDHLRELTTAAGDLRLVVSMLTVQFERLHEQLEDQREQNGQLLALIDMHETEAVIARQLLAEVYGNGVGHLNQTLRARIESCLHNVETHREKIA